MCFFPCRCTETRQPPLGAKCDYLYSMDPEAEAQRSGQEWICLSPCMYQMARYELKCLVVSCVFAPEGWASETGDSKWRGKAKVPFCSHQHEVSPFFEAFSQRIMANHTGLCLV